MNVPGVILINSQQIMSLHIAHEIGAKHHAGTKFMLYASVDLHRTRAFVVRIEHGSAGAKPVSLIQKRAHVVRIGQILEWRERLVQLLIRLNLIGDAPNGNKTAAWTAAECWQRKCAPGSHYGERRVGGGAGGGKLSEGAGLFAVGSVEGYVIPNRIFVEDANARPNYGLAVTLGIPGNTELRSKVQVGLFDRIAQTGHQGIELRNSRKIAVGTASVTNIAQTIRHRNVLSDLPIVPHV